MKKLFIISIFCFAGLINVLGQEKSQEMFNKAIYEEEVNGNLEEAIEAYQTILDEFSDNRSIAAKAQFHIGLCYEKLGLTKAQNAYQKVLDSYPEQTEAVNMAKEKLSIFLNAESLTGKEKPGLKLNLIHLDNGRWGSVSPDGKKLVLCKFDGMQKLFIKNLETGHEKHLYSDHLNTVVDYWAPDSKKIAYVRANGSIIVLFLESGDSKTILGKKHGVMISGWTSDSKNLVVHHPKKGLYKVSLTEPTLNEVFIVGDTTEASKYKHMVLSPNGQYIAWDMETNGNRDVFIQKLKNGKPIRITTNPMEDSQPKWSYDGKRLAFISKRGQDQSCWIIKMTSDGTPEGSPVKISNVGGSTYYWTIDGNISYYIRELVSHIFTNNIDGSNEKQITKLTSSNTNPGCSPDGKFILYNSKIANQLSSIWVIPSTGGQPELIAEGMMPVWSPDSEKIAFVNKNDNVAIVAVKGGVPIEIAQYDGYINLWDWSPDGKNLLIDYSKGDSSENNIEGSRNYQDLYSLPVSGGVPRKLTKGPDNSKVNYASACYDPEGGRIAFRSLDLDKIATGENFFPIWIMDIDGRNKKLLDKKKISDEMFHFHLSWSPDGNYLLATKKDASQSGVWTSGHRIFKIPVDGSKPEPLNIMGYEPEIFPDGKQVVYSKLTEYGFYFWQVENIESLFSQSINK